MSKAPERPLLTVSEAAHRMGISESAAHQLAREGALPGLVALPGHRRVVRRAILEAWLSGHDLPVPPVRLRRVG